MKINIPIFIILIFFMLISSSTLFSIGKSDYFIKQIIFWGISFLILLSSSFVTYNNLLRDPYFKFFYIFIILMLTLLFILPSYRRSWFSFLGFSIQPSEFSRILLVASLSIFLSKFAYQLKNNIFLLFSFLIIAPIVLLILLQPDLGMVSIFLLTWLVSIVIFLNKKQIIGLFLILLLLFIISWFFILKEYQKERILTFINPERKPLEEGYNLRQLKITIGSAGFLGKGYGKGTQARLGFLPSAHTDFILASFIEERGFLGFLFYVFLSLFLLKTIVSEASFIKEPLGYVYSYILAIHFGIRFLLAIMINLGIFPIIGLSVPFLSYGGSHLISDFMLLSIWHNFRYL
ncbi:MAG: FtsW/RodA/SpoVE family cell cycle protein [Minisyncoccia bacterium]